MATAVDDAIHLVEALFTSSIKIDITFEYAATSPGDSANSQTHAQKYAYSTVVSALKGETAGDPLLANEAIPATDPLDGDGNFLNAGAADEHMRRPEAR
jgi:hypothetical protein